MTYKKKRGRKKGQLTTKGRANAIEKLMGKTNNEIAAAQNISPKTVAEQLPAREELGGSVARQWSEWGKKQRLLDRLQSIIDDIPDNAPKHSDIIKAIELVAKLEGIVDKTEGARHLHIHGADLSALSEAQLQQELDRLSSLETLDMGGDTQS